MKLSVIICTHNPRKDYLQRTLESLKTQTLPRDQWELLLIDNASRNPLSGDWDLSWHPNAKHVREDELGLTPARIRGIKESGAELLLFVDDDNVLAEDYFEQSLRISTQMPFLGCFGAGRLEPEFEVEPEPDLYPYTPYLALRSIDTAKWSNDPSDRLIPWGAGLVVTRHIAEAYVETLEASKMRMMLDRKGEELISGGDDEFSWVACENGKGRGIFPELQVLHLIDRGRLTREYFLRLMKGHSFSGVIMNFLHGQELPAYKESPSGWQVLKNLLTFKRSLFIDEGYRWWQFSTKPPIENAIEEAQLEGIKDALKFLER